MSLADAETAQVRGEQHQVARLQQLIAICRGPGHETGIDAFAGEGLQHRPHRRIGIRAYRETHSPMPLEAIADAGDDARPGGKIVEPAAEKRVAADAVP